MKRREIKYFERRAEEARAAAEASDGIVRQTHEKFAAAYAERIAQADIARRAVEEMLG